MDQQLIVFVEVAQRKNFTRAAEALHMSQPAVSQYIASLESDFGVRLLDRNNKSVQINKAGKIVLQYAKEILRNYEQMEVLVSDLKNNPSGELNIGASYTIGEYVLPQMLFELQKKYPLILPNVMIHNTDTITEKLLDHQIDIGLIEGEFAHSDVEIERFALDEMYIIASANSSLVNIKDISIVDLAKQTWIIREQGSGTRIIAERFLKDQTISPQKVLTFGSTQIIKEAVESGIGVSILSKWAIEKELKLGTVYILEVPGIPVTRNFSIIKGKQEFYPKSIQMFEKIVKNSLL